MKLPYAHAEKLLFAAPLLLLILAGAAWLSRKTTSYTIELADSKTLKALEIAPDGKRLVTFFVEARTNNTVGQVYDLETHSKICDLGELPPITTIPILIKSNPLHYWLSWSPDRMHITCGYNDGTQGRTRIPVYSSSWQKKPSFRLNNVGKFVIWDAENGYLLSNLQYAPQKEDSSSGYIRYSPDQKTLIGEGNPPTIFDAFTCQRRQVFRGSFANASEIQLNQKSGFIAETNTNDARLRVFDSKTKSVVWEPQLGTVKNFRWFEDILCIHDESTSHFKRRHGENRLILWNAKTRMVMPAPPIPPDTDIGNFSFSPDKSTLTFFAGKFDPSSKSGRDFKGELIAWDYQRHRLLWRYETNQTFNQLQWSPNGKWLLALSRPTNNTKHLLLFDSAGKQKYTRAVASYITRWTPDSKGIVIFIQEPNVAGRLEVIKVGN